VPSSRRSSPGLVLVHSRHTGARRASVDCAPAARQAERRSGSRPRSTYRLCQRSSSTARITPTAATPSCRRRTTSPLLFVGSTLVIDFRHPLLIPPPLSARNVHSEQQTSSARSSRPASAAERRLTNTTEEPEATRANCAERERERERQRDTRRDKDTNGQRPSEQEKEEERERERVENVGSCNRCASTPHTPRSHSAD
jgi:hypothetical protein